MSTTVNVLLYESLEKVSAYRTVSGEAVYVISGHTPIDLLAFERKKMWTLKKQGTDAAATKEEIKNDTLEQWQARWEQGRHGNIVRWIFTLLRCYPGMDILGSIYIKWEKSKSRPVYTTTRSRTTLNTHFSNAHAGKRAMLQNEENGLRIKKRDLDAGNDM